ncbi:mandelate racemase/muconate lactonizing enzyme family protein [Pelagicoccus sp. SDUM812003]|uniref:mandelate racemase/muconate lactonizing enzyme family protein n=1 Tax=Pelagicoccus sp. SDUM812003 TaxID=3041267 RepID=UPI00280C87D8|nr:mandelate racemase/muconate lactonizing enzyme family protein [Pelagicoccus sp. SDUM812003]MDQ8201421.1 mandelate racemase/muconate lactonizing enzyme family protein [Pelagicoccus sp. SDUM812003]
MKISAIKAFPSRIGASSQLLLKIESDTGYYGWGASGLTSREMAVSGAIDHFRPWLIGKDPRSIGSIWQELYRSQYFEGGRVLAAAQSAIDIALYDLKAKALGIPVYELLGGRQRDWVECFASLPFGNTLQLIERAESLLSAGFTCLRLTYVNEQTMGDAKTTFDPRKNIAAVAKSIVALRQHVGQEPTLGFDYHHRLTTPETVSFLHRMPIGTLDFLEEPIRCEDPKAYATLRQLVDVPFAIGEEFASKWQFLPFLENGLTQFARVDVCNVGGLTESMKVAALAEAHYIDLMPHNPLGPICAAATIHLAAACSNVSWLEEVNTPIQDLGLCDPKIFPLQPRREQNRYPISDTPGLGIEVDEDALANQTFTPIEVPHFKRADGSVTNW